MQTIINILVFCLILGIIILIHEFGHFITAKYFGVFCSEFSLGMGPKIWSKKIGETDYQVRALPIGGYVAMAGEADQEDNEDMKDVPYERTLKGIKTWKKCVIMLAGVFMNFLLAIVLLIGVYSFVDMPVNSSEIGGVVEGYGAQEAGMKKGDVINKITIANEEYLIGSYSDIQKVLSKNNVKSDEAELQVKITFSRKSSVYEKTIRARYDEESQSYHIGIRQKTRSLTFFEAVRYGFDQFVMYATIIFSTLAKLITHLTSTVQQLSGPAGIYSVTAQITESGSISTLISFTALLSTNVGMFNLIPIPGLDGAHVLISIIERIIGREIPQKIKYSIQMAGLILIFALMIYVTINDVGRMF
ncbi:MAG: M50 family metallopeptidase [Faecalibacillus sp.]